VPRLRMLPSAQADPVNILEHITRESGHLAIGRRFIGALRQQCRELAALPGTLGRARPELRPDIRSFACKGYVILFRYIDDVFEVVDIIEGHRDIEALYYRLENDPRFLRRIEQARDSLRAGKRVRLEDVNTEK
jgi:toxin ParE1/3/4